MSEPPNLPRPRHEPTDVTFRFAVLWFGGIAATLGLFIGIAMALFPATRTQHPVTMPVPQFPAPTLQSSPRADMAEFLRAELERLNSTGWVDRSKATVHIPIADAMRKVADEGIPGWPAPPAPRDVRK